MATPLVDEQLLQTLTRLTPEQQLRVLDYARSLGDGRRGTAVKDPLRFVGLFPPDDLAEMAEAIKDCERVDIDEW